MVRINNFDWQDAHDLHILRKSYAPRKCLLNREQTVRNAFNGTLFHFRHVQLPLWRSEVTTVFNSIYFNVASHQFKIYFILISNWAGNGSFLQQIPWINIYASQSICLKWIWLWVGEFQRDWNEKRKWNAEHGADTKYTDTFMRLNLV